MIELHNVCKSYRTSRGLKTVLDGISISLPRDRNIGILGRNGAGKSTLLRMISGAELPTRGEVRRHASVSWVLGFSGGFHGSLTGRENLRFICRIYDADIVKATAFVEEFSELGEYMEMPVNTYSSGMKAKLAFGLSMAINFEYYLIDEVTAVGDSRFQKKCKDEFDRRKQLSSLLVVSHNPATIRSHCDVAAVLEHGRLTFFEDVEQAIVHYES